MKKNMAAPCGLNCSACPDFLVTKECHGCGCNCNECAGQWHFNHCFFTQCTSNKGIESCADCNEMPCTELIQFTNDPIWTTHSVCIENLKRRIKIGTEAWIEEQSKYFTKENIQKAIRHHDLCAENYKILSESIRKQME